MSSDKRTPRFKAPVQRPDRPTQWPAAILLILIPAVIAGLAVNFVDHVHYAGLLQQANLKAISAQTELAKEQYDLKFLIKNDTTPINCYDLRSAYARSLCSSHDGGNG